ncbi:hypothetical protein EVAR_54752_1 [Eumeta japonica]|uniref:Uncharacterized protein n=1 Tax=Eumeta variegata TaxID=151549 RepID=A0A4C1YZY6_EUMVA|nr:hypothetical protein EVAR_54752_1 [Eumeta japonica]
MFNCCVALFLSNETGLGIKLELNIESRIGVGTESESSFEVGSKKARRIKIDFRHGTSAQIFSCGALAPRAHTPSSPPHARISLKRFYCFWRRRNVCSCAPLQMILFARVLYGYKSRILNRQFYHDLIVDDRGRTNSSVFRSQVYTALFAPLRVSRRQFRRVLQCMRSVKHLKCQELYAHEKVTKVDSLSLVLSGK